VKRLIGLEGLQEVIPRSPLKPFSSLKLVKRLIGLDGLQEAFALLMKTGSPRASEAKVKEELEDSYNPHEMKIAKRFTMLD
jgi:hypothetical protein